MTARSAEYASHEAAHAVIGCYLGLSCIEVRLVGGPETEERGYARFNLCASKRMAWGVMLAAGLAAEALCGRKPLPYRDGDVGGLIELGFSKHERVMLQDLATYYLAGPCAAQWKRVTEVLTGRDLRGREVKDYVVNGEQLED